MDVYLIFVVKKTEVTILMTKNDVSLFLFAKIDIFTISLKYSAPIGLIKHKMKPYPDKKIRAGIENSTK